MRRYGIIGYPLEHSFSAEFFTRLFSRENISAIYSALPAGSFEEVKLLLADTSLSGCNITHPWKIDVINLLDELSPQAAEIGAVNVVARVKNTNLNTNNNKKTLLVGYNTDAEGFEVSIKNLLGEQLFKTPVKAIVLGTGGAAKCALFVLKKLNIPTIVVSRTSKGDINYSQLTITHFADHKLIVNCTPCGMFPHKDECPDIPYQYITEQHFVMDMIYNPEQTLFLRKAQLQGAHTLNGMLMLTTQAAATWKIWQNAMGI